MKQAYSNPLISIILPIYNTESYLKKCIESVLNQKYDNLEIICIDDGSTDNSGLILDEYARKDFRIKALHKKNGGESNARNTGLQIMSGQYIGFIDCDDWIEPDMYEKLYGYAVRDQADMVSSGYIFEGNYITTHYDDVPEGLYDPEEMDFLRANAIYNLGTKDVGIRGSLCCKIFLAEKFKEVQLNIPEEISMSEDKLCILSYLLVCNRVSVLKKAFYHYMIHQESMVHTPDPGYLLKVNGVYQYFIKLYNHPLFTETMRMQAELYVTEMLYKGINSRMGFENRNLFWIDPYWLREIPQGSKVALYGGGELGYVYRRQLKSREDLTFVGWLDLGWERFKNDSMETVSLEELLRAEYDVVVITIKNPSKAQEVRGQLVEVGIPEYRIRWFEQKELYWKYAEANGWIR